MADESKYPSETADRFQVRLPDGMRDRIKAAADANNRSMNAEIVARLDSTLRNDSAEVRTAFHLGGANYLLRLIGKALGDTEDGRAVMAAARIISKARMDEVIDAIMSVPVEELPEADDDS